MDVFEFVNQVVETVRKNYPNNTIYRMIFDEHGDFVGEKYLPDEIEEELALEDPSIHAEVTLTPVTKTVMVLKVIFTYGGEEHGIHYKIVLDEKKFWNFLENLLSELENFPKIFQKSWCLVKKFSKKF